jgi:hypothetical protein
VAFDLAVATGSMNHTVALNSQVTRAQLVYQSVRLDLNLALADDAEDKWDLSNGIGTPIITFNAMDGGVYRGLLHSNNLEREFGQIAFRGGTHIMDGWKKMFDQYEAKFRDLPQGQWPLLLCLLITDGEIQDAEEFERHLARVRGRLFVDIAVVGFGEDHDRALQHYAKISRKHPHVRANQFSNSEDAEAVARQLLSLVNLGQYCAAVYPQIVQPQASVPDSGAAVPPPAYIQSGETNQDASAPRYQP